MNAKELAEILNGREYPFDPTEHECRLAEENGLVIVFGASDDLMEFRGAIVDEIGCYDGGTTYLNNKGLLQNDCDDQECPYFEKLKDKATTIEAICHNVEEGYSWTYETKIPHETFEIMQGDEKYCRGIVFALADVICNTAES